MLLQLETIEKPKVKETYAKMLLRKAKENSDMIHHREEIRKIKKFNDREQDAFINRLSNSVEYNLISDKVHEDRERSFNTREPRKPNDP